MDFRTAAVAVLLLALTIAPACAQKNYGPGASDTEVKIGTTAPLSGPLSTAGAAAKSFAAYFDKVNEDGGINGRKIKVIIADDSYAPPRTVDQTRKLVEQDGVLFMAASLGTPTQLAVQRYLNDRAVPQLFPVATGAAPFYDPQNSRWTVGFAPSNTTEGRLVAKYVSATSPAAKIAVLYENDDFGKDFLRGAKETLSNGAAIVAEQSFEPSDPTVDAEIAGLQASGADTLFVFASQKAAAQAIRHAAEIGWQAKIFIPSVASSIGQVLQPAGLENAKRVFTATYMKDPTSPAWANDPDIREFIAWAATYDKSVDLRESLAGASAGYVIGSLIEKILKAAGNDLSRENILNQATTLHDVGLRLLPPGITVNTSPSDYRAIKQLQFETFDGENWVPSGKIVSE